MQKCFSKGAFYPTKSVWRIITSEKLASPAPLGLLGFGMTTVLAMFVHNARLGPVDGMILGMGIFYGGLAQIIAGIL